MQRITTPVGVSDKLRSTRDERRHTLRQHAVPVVSALVGLVTIIILIILVPAKGWIEAGNWWAAVSAFAGIASAAAIFLAVWQLRFDAWLKAQEVYTETEFTEARKAVFAHFECPEPDTCLPSDEALIVCRKMDEIAHLSRFLGTHRVIDVWGHPIAKAWLLLKATINRERLKDHWDEKWIAFDQLGEKAAQRHTTLKEVRAGYSGGKTCKLSPTTPPSPTCCSPAIPPPRSATTTVP